MKSSFVIIFITLTIMTTIYLNQEVPACIDNPILNQTTVTNYSTSTVNSINNELESNILAFQTFGNSMLPEIKPGQRCACMKQDSYQVGDIVLFFVNFGNGFTGIAHKVISINITDDKIVTMGVNNKETDYPIKKENILCKIPVIKRRELLYG